MHHGNASFPESTLFHVIKAFSEAATPEDRRLYLRAALKALAYTAGRTHIALMALAAALSEGK